MSVKTESTLHDRLEQVPSIVRRARAKHDTCLLCGTRPLANKIDKCSIVRGAGYVCDDCLPDKARDEWAELRRLADA